MNLHHVNENGIDGRQFAVADGTIVNRTALTQELKLANPSLEDLIHEAFMRWGLEFPSHLEGTFAVAVFDVEHNRLILARDRFGSIPLYFISGRTVAFSSFTDHFLQQEMVPRTASLQAIWDYLTLGAVPQPNTIIAGVQSLRPAQLATIDLKGGQVERKTWWSLTEEAEKLAVNDLSFEQAGQKVREIIDDTLNDMRPFLGNSKLLLSGGMDSTVLLTAMALQDYPLETLTIAFEKKHQDFNENQRAEEFARQANAKHTTVTVTDWDMAKSFPKFIRNMDQPSRDGLNLFHAAKAARAGDADSIVTGLGGDELFAGYPHVRRHIRAERMAPLLGPLKPLLRRLPDRFRHNLMLPALTRAERLETVRAQLYEQAKRQAVNPELLTGKSVKPWLEACRDFTRNSLSCTRQCQWFDQSLDLEHTLLRDTFLQANPHHVMPFTPLLNHRLAALAFALPDDYKFKHGTPKALLLQAYRDLVPPKLLNHTPKRGFELPLLRWLGSTLLPKARETFNSPQAKLIFTRQNCLNWSYRLTSLQPRDYPLWSRFILLQYLITRNITTFA